ncbi:MAG: 50S ribosomal protein L35 [Clostridia bacterium]|nr:50S ribosomal protein L35 [Clostridia bacterium]
MPKLKTNRAANKRYGFTGSGKIKRTKANRRHLLVNKTKRQKHTARVQDGILDNTCKSHVKKLLPYG